MIHYAIALKWMDNNLKSQGMFKIILKIFKNTYHLSVKDFI